MVFVYQSVCTALCVTAVVCCMCVCGRVFSTHCVCVLALGHPGGRDEAKEQRS